MLGWQVLNSPACSRGGEKTPGLQYPPWGQCSQRGRGRLPAPEGRPCTENGEGPHGRPPRWPAGAGPGAAEPNEKLDRAVRARGEGGQRPAFGTGFLGHRDGGRASRMTEAWREGRKDILGGRHQPKRRREGRKGQGTHGSWKQTELRARAREPEREQQVLKTWPQPRVPSWAREGRWETGGPGGLHSGPGDQTLHGCVPSGTTSSGKTRRPI